MTTPDPGDRVKISNVTKSTLSALFSYLSDHPEKKYITHGQDANGQWRALTWEREEIE